MNKLAYILTVLFSLMLGEICAQQVGVTWGFTGGGGNTDRITNVAIDAMGNTFMAGEFEDSVKVSNGNPAEYVKGGGYKDIFLAKFDKDGNKIWAHGFGDTGRDYPWGMELDPNGGVFMGGIFYGTVDFDPGAGTTSFTSNPAGFWVDGYLAKYDDNGELQWAKHLKTARDRNASHSAVLLTMRGMDVDASGNLIVGGSLWDSVWFAPNSLVVSQTSLRDMFLAKYDPSGNLLWVKHFPASSDQQITNLAVDSNGDIAVTGWVIGSVDLDPGAGTNMMTSKGQMDPFVAKYDANGNHLWGFGLGSAGASEEGRGVSVDGNNNIYITGRIREKVDFDPGSDSAFISRSGLSDLYVAKYSPQGALQWAFGLDGGTSEIGEDIDVLPNGEFVVGGIFGAAAGLDLDPGPDTFAVYNNPGGEDVFVARYDASGSFLYGFEIRGLDEDVLSSVAVSGDNIAAGGYFGRTILLNRTTGDLRFANGPTDMWVLRFGQKTSGIASLVLRKNLKTYPNPAKYDISLSADWGKVMEAEVQIRDLQGRLVANRILPPASTLDLKMDISGLSSGNYTISLILPVGMQTQTLIKH
ncbi:MAG: T9SS type A sorting domain-containing protein [Bacteroidia bacterium]